MEKFNPEDQNLRSEDSSLEFEKLREERSTENYLNSISSAPESYTNEELVVAYKEKVLSLHKKISEIERYISAKEGFEIIRYDLEQKFMGDTPLSGVTINERMADLKKFELIINSFEKDGVPEKVQKEAQRELDALKETITTIIEVQNAAKNFPEKN